MGMSMKGTAVWTVYFKNCGGNAVRTYLVTGGAGFIGSNFILFMLNKYKDLKIINADALTYAGNLKNLSDAPDRHIFVKADINDDLTEVFETYQPEKVVNFAAESHVDRSINDPGIFIKTNVLGTLNLLNAAKKFGVKKFLQVSTDEVYGALGSEGFYHRKYAPSTLTAHIRRARRLLICWSRHITIHMACL